jgi:hypothetical protein
MARAPRHTCGSGRVGFGRVSGFLVIIFGLCWVGSGYFLNSGENFGLCPARRTIKSGRIGFFFVWVGSGLSGRVAHDQV